MAIWVRAMKHFGGAVRQFAQDDKGCVLIGGGLTMLATVHIIL
jgi:hypothetical protein